MDGKAEQQARRLDACESQPWEWKRAILRLESLLDEEVGSVAAGHIRDVEARLEKLEERLLSKGEEATTEAPLGNSNSKLASLEDKWEQRITSIATKVDQLQQEIVGSQASLEEHGVHIQAARSRLESQEDRQNCFMDRLESQDLEGRLAKMQPLLRQSGMELELLQARVEDLEFARKEFNKGVVEAVRREYNRLVVGDHDGDNGSRAPAPPTTPQKGISGDPRYQLLSPTSAVGSEVGVPGSPGGNVAMYAVARFEAARAVERGMREVKEEIGWGGMKSVEELGLLKTRVSDVEGHCKKIEGSLGQLPPVAAKRLAGVESSLAELQQQAATGFMDATSAWKRRTTDPGRPSDIGAGELAVLRARSLRADESGEGVQSKDSIHIQDRPTFAKGRRELEGLCDTFMLMRCESDSDDDAVSDDMAD